MSARRRATRHRRQVLIRRHGGRPRGSQLLDGVFFSSLLGITTFQRSRDFDIDRVSPANLRDIAERVRRRFHQQSVLSFDYAEHRRHSAPAVEVEVPGVSAERVRDGFLAEQEARQRLQGGSVTLDGRLILIAAREDVALVERFVAEIGGDFGGAPVRPGWREFVGSARVEPAERRRTHKPVLRLLSRAAGWPGQRSRCQENPPDSNAAGSG
jgi:hypothetical protein